MPKLKNKKHEMFVQEYLVDLNQTQAYIRAGYSPNGASDAASKLMAIARVRARVDELLAARSRRVGVSQDRVVRELARLAFVDPTAVFDTTTATLRADASEDDRAAIAGVKVKQPHCIGPLPPLSTRVIAYRLVLCSLSCQMIFTNGFGVYKIEQHKHFHILFSKAPKHYYDES